MQDSPLGTPVTVIQATDEDFQLNGIVVYSFGNSTSSGPFLINSATGEIVLLMSLDREASGGAQHNLTVVASDQRGIGPEVRTTSRSFTVEVQDVNDNIPQFNDLVSYCMCIVHYGCTQYCIIVHGWKLGINSGKRLYHRKGHIIVAKWLCSTFQ